LRFDLIGSEDQRRLVALARYALEARVRRQPPPTLHGDGTSTSTCGAFVSLHRGGTLRGCLGRIQIQASLEETIAQLAASVADSDPRFAPVSPDELLDLVVEISVLGPEREIGSIAEIVVGRHGLIVEQGPHRGLLLPQVATEQRWDPETFVSHTCLKAGLPPHAWRHGARILTFEAQVFGEA
jgi:AmmeMemoRadiSam system protein A